MNNITISGVVASAPELNYTESNLAATSFFLIFNMEENKSLKCLFYGKRAERLANEVIPGARLVISGNLIRQGKENKHSIYGQDFEILKMEGE